MTAYEEVVSKMKEALATTTTEESDLLQNDISDCLKRLSTSLGSYIQIQNSVLTALQHRLEVCCLSFLMSVVGCFREQAFFPASSLLFRCDS